MSGAPKTSGTYPGRPDLFIVDVPRKAREYQRAYWFSWRPCTVWERPVLDRAYARQAAVEAALVTVAGR